MKKQINRGASLMLALLLLGYPVFNIHSFALAENDVEITQEVRRTGEEAGIESASEEDSSHGNLASSFQEEAKSVTDTLDGTLSNGEAGGEAEDSLGAENSTPPVTTENIDDDGTSDGNLWTEDVEGETGEGLTDDALSLPLEESDQEVGAVLAGAGEKTFTVTKRTLLNPEAQEELVGEFDTFIDAIESCSQGEYIITMNRDYTIPLDENYGTIQSANILLRSKGEEQFTLVRTGDDKALLAVNGSGSGCTFKTESIIVDGNEEAWAFSVENGGNLTLGAGTVVQNFSDYANAQVPAIFVKNGTLNIVEGATIQRNKTESSNSGGAIEVQPNGIVNVSGGRFLDNTTSYHGGVFLSWGTINISGGVFERNSAEISGGVIGAYGGVVNITGGIFTENSASENGGVVSFGSAGTNLTVNHATLSNNTAQKRGGAINTSSRLEIEGSSFTGNSVAKWGGAIFVNSKDQDVTVNGATLTNNQAKVSGGAIYLQNGILSLSDSNFINNSGSSGGALLIGGNIDSVKVQTCSFSENFALRGGGIYLYDKSKLYLSASNFSENDAANGGAIATWIRDIDTVNSYLRVDGQTKFVNNSAYQGGAILTSFPTEITNVSFIGNSARLADGDDGSNPHSSGVGGAIYVADNNTKILSSEFNENYAYGSGGAIGVNGYKNDENAGTTVKPNIMVEISQESKFISNSVGVGQGGAIYVAPYQYEAEITDDKAYKNLETDSTTLFEGNYSGGGLFTPPTNYEAFKNLGFDKNSDVLHDVLEPSSLLNNYDVNYMSEWIKWIISFDANGGTGEMKKATVDTAGSSYALPACAFTAPPGKEFAGWEIKGDNYAVGDSIMVNENIVVKALWKDATPESEPEPEEPPVEKIVSVTKIWNDNDNREGLRPSSVTFRLLADGEATDRTLTLSGQNRWFGEFTDIKRYDGDRRIVYTIVEDDVDGYVSEIRGNDWSGFTVTNSLVGRPTESTEPMEPTEPTREKYLITYELLGGAFDGKLGPITFEVDLGEVITILDAPTREGYSFSHWEGSKFYPGDSYVVTGDHTFTAVWETTPSESTTESTSTTEPTEAMKPSEPTNTTEAGLPQTGEEIQGVLWLSSILLVAAGVLPILRRRLKRFD